MIGSNQYNLTWDHFDELHPDKRTSFENLCRSLFQRTFCDEGTILHSDPNHPGVEVEPVFSKKVNGRISFQSKYFDSAVGYSQIKSSAKKTIDHYKGRIDKVYLYSNKDISGASKQYAEIVAMLESADIEIILITGQTILDQVAEYPTILATYFGLDYLDSDWFKGNLQLSLNNLGKRYNANFNIDTRAQEKIEIFLREESGISRINEKKTELANELKSLLWRCNSEEKKHVAAIRNKVLSIENISTKNITDALLWCKHLKESCCDELSVLTERKTKLLTELEKLSYKDKDYELFRNAVYRLERINSLFDILKFSQEEMACINAKVLLVKGLMGAGKTQLLASSAKRLTDNGHTVLLYLGQTFTSSDPLEKQMIECLHGLNDSQTMESLLNVLEEEASNYEKDAIIFIDAINESLNKEIWKQGINKLISQVEQFNHIKLVLSLRSGFENLTLSDKVIEESEPSNGSIATIIHNGLLEDSPKAVYEFMSNSGVPFSPEYYLKADMSNPLFLTWFCQTYAGEESDILPLVKKVIDNADLEASKASGSQEPYGAMESFLNAFITFKNDSAHPLPSKRNLLEFDIWNTYGITNKVAYLKAAERYGVINTYVVEGQEVYYIGYNLLEEYLSAKQLLCNSIDAQNAKENIKNTLYESIDGKVRIKYNCIEIFTMAASLYANKYGEEIIDCLEEISDDWDKHFVVEQYFVSLAKRNNISFDRFLLLIKKYPVSPRIVWDIFIENATKVNSELNANGLTKLLMGYELNRRDYLWTTEINGFYEDDRIVSLAYYIEEGNDFSSDDEKIDLLLTLFAWMLSSSKRVLRDRVSKAMVEILKGKFQLCLPLLIKFKGVNDPYIIQRLYGIVFGAVMKRTKPFAEEYVELARWVINNVFAVNKVYPDILLRDYARLIVERFAYEFPEIASSFDIKKVRPPYISDPIPNVEPIDYGSDEYKVDGVSSIIFSMTFDTPVKGRGMYGDFGRYTFQSALNTFKNIDFNNVFYYSLEYIFQELGYTTELFGEYDSQIISRSRHDSKKTERIGKKYQWIAMYNILARISDTNKVGNQWDWNDKIGVTYSGPWEPYVRDFDPTLNLRYGINPETPKIQIPEYSSDEFIQPESSEDDIQRWVRDDSRIFTDFPRRLILKDDLGTEWVTLYHYIDTRYKPLENEDCYFGIPNGEQSIWTITSAYVKKCSVNSDEFLEILKKHQFANLGHEVRSCYSLYSREYAWSPGYYEEFKMIEDAETELDDVIPTTINVLWEEEFDASQDEVTSFMIPAGEIINALGLKEKEYDGYYYFGDELVAFDMKLAGKRNHELVIRRDYLQQFLRKTSSKLFWSVIGEKQFFRGELNQIWQRKEGCFVFSEQEIIGEIINAND